MRVDSCLGRSSGQELAIAVGAELLCASERANVFHGIHSYGSYVVPDGDGGPVARRDRHGGMLWRLAFMAWVLALGLVPALGLNPAIPSHHTNRVLVKPRDDADPSVLRGLHQGMNARVLRVLEGQGNVTTLELGEGWTVGEAVARYRRSGLVQFAEPDYRVSAATTLPSDPWFQNGTLWGLNNYGQGGGMSDADLDAPEGWDVARSATNVIIAIIDSGIRTTHLDLAENLWRDPLEGVYGTNAISGGYDVTDEFGHGTHVAGIIGAIGDNGRGVVGVAWRTRIMACKFLDGQGEGFSSDAAACIEYASERGARVINLSWGGPVMSETLSNAIYTAQVDGILFVAGAGNHGRNIDEQPYYPASLGLDNVISVGASTRLDTVWIASGYGVGGVDLYAPGLEIYSTSNTGDNDYTSLNGTSMAAAYVTGALALLRDQMTDAPYHEVKARLLAGVDQREPFAERCVTGGRLNLRKALDRPMLELVNHPCANCPVEQQRLAWHLLVRGIGGHAYVLQTSPDLTVWHSLKTNILNTTGNWALADPESTTLVRRFYRAIPGP